MTEWSDDDDGNRRAEERRRSRRGGLSALLAAVAIGVLAACADGDFLVMPEDPGISAVTGTDLVEASAVNLTQGAYGPELATRAELEELELGECVIEGYREKKGFKQKRVWVQSLRKTQTEEPTGLAVIRLKVPDGPVVRRFTCRIPDSNAGLDAMFSEYYGLLPGKKNSDWTTASEVFQRSQAAAMAALGEAFGGEDDGDCDFVECIDVTIPDACDRDWQYFEDGWLNVFEVWDVDKQDPECVCDPDNPFAPCHDHDEEPSDTTGGSGPGGPPEDGDEECDPTIEDPSDGGCGDETEEEEEEVEPQPCAGNPIQHPRIAPQLGASGMPGARVGEGVRSGGTRDHWGVDLADEIGDPIYAMYGGVVTRVRMNPGGFGGYLTVKSTVNGQVVEILYAHMAVQVENGSTVQAGDVLGLADESGLKDAKDAGFASQHLHLEARLFQQGRDYFSVPKAERLALTAEDIMTTKFDANGDVIPGTSCEE